MQTKTAKSLKQKNEKVLEKNLKSAQVILQLEQGLQWALKEEEESAVQQHEEEEAQPSPVRKLNRVWEEAKENLLVLKKEESKVGSGKVKADKFPTRMGEGTENEEGKRKENLS